MKCSILPVVIFFTNSFYSANCFGDQYAGIYNTPNEVLALREELQVDGLEEDFSFNGGKGVVSWVTLPSYHNTYLIGVKKRGLSLISISKRVGNLFQAVEKQIDIGHNITSIAAFSSLNQITQRMEELVVVSTDSPKHEILWFKIQNYKLVQFWTWIRYSGTLSLHHFNVMREDMLLILDPSAVTAYLYSISFDAPTPKIRELEVLPFNERVISLSVSLKLPEPFLFTLHQDGMRIYRYKRFCSETLYGSFLQQALIQNQGITKIYPFHSGGNEYLAVSGKESGVLRIDPFGNINQDMKVENIMEWIIMRTGPNKERILLFGKTIDEEVQVFSNVGLGWSQYEAPPCYKYDKTSKEKAEVKLDLGCIRTKSWHGVVSLDLGDLPTLIFGDRKYGEMYHVMLSMKRDILPLQQIPLTDNESYNYLKKMKSNLEEMISNIGDQRSSYKTCSIFGMLTTIENIAADAKGKISETCAHLSPKSASDVRNEHNTESSMNVLEGRSNNYLKHATDNSKIESLEEIEKDFKKSEVETFSPEQILSTTEDPLMAKKFSPDLDDDLAFPEFNDINGDYHLAGFPKRKMHLIN